MKVMQRSAVFGAMLACSAAAFATSPSLNESHPNKVMPVLVQVNSDGQVTDVSPAMELSPGINQLLRTKLGEMISNPAIDKQGRAISSQFVINMTVQASLLDDGNYDTHFTYLSTEPLPVGSWHWVHLGGDQIALARKDSSYRRQLLVDDVQQHRELHYQPARVLPTPTNNPAYIAQTPLPPRQP